MLPAILPELLSVTSVFKSGSPRYEGGPLISSVQERLAQVKAGDPAAIAQSKADAVTGGAGWKDAALVLAPSVRPDLLGNPHRALTADEQGIVAPYLPGNPIPTAAASSNNRTTSGAAPTIGEQIASFFGFGPSQQQAAAVSAGTAAGAQVSSGLVKAAVIVALVVVAIVILPKLVKRFA